MEWKQCQFCGKLYPVEEMEHSEGEFEWGKVEFWYCGKCCWDYNFSEIEFNVTQSGFNPNYLLKVKGIKVRKWSEMNLKEKIAYLAGELLEETIFARGRLKRARRIKKELKTLKQQ